ncbi:MAG: hypothetical protein PCFJNLEI_03262 [Verrucomicrobiae bacterium]|nr:hypothetical protein [Verrucomicrobiae bacterium]
MKKLQIIMSGLAVMVALAGVPKLEAQGAPAKVTVIHGISGLPEAVGVYANGNFLFAFDFEDVQGPLELPAGSYDLEVKLGTNVVLSGTANVEDGKDYTVVAHFTYTGGAPGIKLSVFENPTTPLCEKQSRLVVRHLANAPAVDAVVSRGATTTRNFVSTPNLASADGGNNQGGAVDFKSGTYRAQLYVAGTTTSAFDSGKLKLDGGVSYIAYAIGSLPDDTFTVYIQTIELPTFSCK